MPLKNKINAVLKSRLPAIFALAYAVFGAVWVTVNNRFLAGLSSNPATHTLIDLLFIAITGCTLYLLFKSWREPSPALSGLRRGKLHSRTPYLVAVLAGLLLLVPLINFGVQYFYAPKVAQAAYRNLGLIARIKVVQFERWRDSRQGDAEVLASDHGFSELVQDYATRQSEEARRRIAERFDAMIAAYEFEGIALLDPEGGHLLQRGSIAASDAVRQMLIAQARTSGKVQHSDLYLVDDQRAQLDVLAPLTLRQGEARPIVGFVIIHTGIDRQILPRVLSWPSSSSSSSSEVLIVRNDGETEAIIHNVRDTRQAAVVTRPRAAATPYDPALVLQQGLDYQGKGVLVAQEPLHGSDWTIVTQTDQAEVMAPLETLLLWISALTLLAVTLLALALVVLWRQQHKTHRLELLSETGERDRMLKRFFDLPFVGMAVLDPATTRWLQVNDRLCQIFGYTRDEMLGMTWVSVTHPADLAKDLNDFQRCARGEIQSYALEKRFLHKSGNTLIARIEVNCEFGVDGRVESFLVALEDITLRKQAEEALRSSEERLALVLKGSNDGWWDVDLVNNTTYHSPRWWEIVGYTADQDEVDPGLWQRLTHPDDLQPTYKHLRRVIGSDQVSYEQVMRLRHRKGHYVTVLIKGYVLRDEHGVAIRISGTSTDLTERLAAEQKLRAQEEFSRVLVENQVDGVIACDADMKLVIFNQTAREWHGVDVLDVPPERWSEHFGLYDADGIELLRQEQIPLVRAFNGEHLQHAGVAIRAKGQEMRLLSCSAAPFFDGKGKKLGAVAILRDVTDMLRQAKALRESETLYREMFDASPHPMWVFDSRTFAFLSVNDAAVSHYGWTRQQFMEMTIFDVWAESEADRLRDHLPEMMEHDVRQSGEWLLRKHDGSVVDVEIASHSLNFSGVEARLVLAYDITERKQSDLEIKTLNRLMQMLSNVNQTIVRRLDPLAMFQEACTIAVRDGQFRMAWIGLVEEDGTVARSVASAGEVGDYLESITVDIGDLEKYGPSTRAIREGRHTVCEDIANDPDFGSCREQALANGYRSMVALPLVMHGKVIGNFSLYSADTGIFNKRELDLLDELAEDISFALEVAEAEEEKQRAELALQESEALFHTLASISPVGILRTDTAGNTLYVNARGCEMAGISEQPVSGEAWTRATHPDDRQRVYAQWQAAVREQRGFSTEYRFLHEDGAITWVKAQAEAEVDSENNFLGFVGTITDITALKASEESLRMSAAVFENTREGVLVTDAETRIIMVNRAFSDITQYGDADVLGRSPKLMSSGRHGPEFFQQMWQSLVDIGYWQGEIWNRRKNGDIHPVLMSISVIKDQDGDVINYVGVFADISNLKASEAQLEFLAHHDPLTRLPNRLMLISRLGHAIEVSRRENTLIALLMMDLDRFKDVNDNFGHLAGDELLQQVAERLTKRLRGVDTLTRLGGDEFTVLLEQIPQAEDAARVAEDIIEVLEAPYKLANNIEVRISASVGISIYPNHAGSALELLQHADAALYQAKSAGRGCARYFSESLTQAARDRFSMEARLRKARASGELRLYYQPQINIASNHIVGAEALVRWQDPTEGLILPARFISIAEDTGLIGEIGEWVMEEACTQGRRWLDQGLPSLSIAINLSAQQLHHSDIVEKLSAIIRRTGFPASSLELELTESILMQRESEIIETLNALRSLGIRLAIDDFGTGYSSLAYLKSFPLDILKIDKSFVHDIERDQDDRAITATIIGIAHTLGMQVVAEGVETSHQLEFLRTHDCDYYQGYILSKPLPAEDFAALVRAHNKRADGK